MIDFDGTWDDFVRDEETRERNLRLIEVRDAEEIDAAPLRTCCDDPTNYTMEPGDHIPDPDTGFVQPNFYRCNVCRNLIEDFDYINLVKWHRDPTLEPDAVPAEIDERTKVPEKRIA